MGLDSIQENAYKATAQHLGPEALRWQPVVALAEVTVKTGLTRFPERAELVLMAFGENTHI